MELKKVHNSKLPDSPGVYFFRYGKTILYIGKATSLRDRVRSYFGDDLIKTRGPRLVDMVTRADSIDYQKTNSVLEALVLEAELIKKHKPQYNTKEKDNKSYNFVVITKEDFPTVKIERGRAIDFQGTKDFKYIFGPFPSVDQLNKSLKIIRSIFPFRDHKCSRLIKARSCLNQAKNGKKVLKPCFNYHIGLCPGTCIGGISKTAYAQNVRHVALFFQGKTKELKKRLEKQMLEYAKKEQFEKAQVVKRQIFSLEHINDVSLLQDSKNLGKEAGLRIESYDIAHTMGNQTIGVMTVIEDGEIKKSDYRQFIIRKAKKADDLGALQEVLERRLKHTEWQFPNLIVVDGGENQRKRMMHVLKELHVKVPVVSVVKDEKHKPKGLYGPENFVKKYKKEIILSNSEAHRFAITLHRKKRGREFIQ